MRTGCATKVDLQQDLGAAQVKNRHGILNTSPRLQGGGAGLRADRAESDRAYSYTGPATNCGLTTLLGGTPVGETVRAGAMPHGVTVGGTSGRSARHD